MLDKFQYTNLFRNYYEFIVDAHFHVENTSMADSRHSFYVSEHYQFYLEEDEFWLAGKEGVKLLSINNDQDVTSYLKPSLNDQGDIVYNLGTFSTYLNRSHRDWEISLLEGNQARVETINLRTEAKTLAGYQLGDRFALSEKEGIPWLQWRSMFVYEKDPFDYYDIIQTAKKLKGEPYFILDLRGNQGGSMILVEKWLEAFLGEPLGWDSQSIHLISKTSRTFVQDTIDFYKEQGISLQTFDNHFTDLYRVNLSNALLDPYWDIDENSYQTVQNDSHIFILIDHHTASAAEHLVSKLKQVNKTTVIGMNTMGALISGNSLMWKLPHTHVEMSVPTFFNYHPKLLDKESIGIQPDLWVRPDRVEQRILTFIQKSTKKS